jgi:hypothetical protein
MMDFQDWKESFESAEDRESFDQWLQEIEAQEHVDFVQVGEVNREAF